MLYSELALFSVVIPIYWFEDLFCFFVDEEVCGRLLTDLGMLLIP